MNRKNLEEQLEELVNFEESGNGFGSPEAKEAHDRKIDLLKHKQLLKIEKSNHRMTLINTFVALINVSVFIYQVFIKD